MPFHQNNPTIIVTFFILFFLSIPLHSQSDDTKWEPIHKSEHLQTFASSALLKKLNENHKNQLTKTTRDAFQSYRKIFFRKQKQDLLRKFRNQYASREIFFSAAIEGAEIPGSDVREKLQNYKPPELTRVYFDFEPGGEFSESTSIARPFRLTGHTPSRDLKEIRLTLRGAGVDFQTKMEIRHEIFHAFYNRRFQGTKPEWLNEGLAEFLPIRHFARSNKPEERSSLRQYVQSRISSAKEMHESMNEDELLQFVRGESTPVIDKQYISLAWAFTAYLEHIKQGAIQTLLSGIMQEFLRVHAFQDTHPAKRYVHAFFQPDQNRNVRYLQDDFRQFLASLAFDPSAESGIQGKQGRSLQFDRFPLPILDLSRIRTDHENPNISNTKSMIKINYSPQRKRARLSLKRSKVSRFIPRDKLTHHLKKLNNVLAAKPVKGNSIREREKKLNKKIFGYLSSNLSLQNVSGSISFKHARPDQQPEVLVGVHFSKRKPNWNHLRWFHARNGRIPPKTFYRNINHNRVWILAYWRTPEGVIYLKARNISR